MFGITRVYKLAKQDRVIFFFTKSFNIFIRLKSKLFAIDFELIRFTIIFIVIFFLIFFSVFVHLILIIILLHLLIFLIIFFDLINVYFQFMIHATLIFKWINL